MTPDNAAHPQEIELKLALPASDPLALAKRLARLPLLVRRKATQLQLHNIYFDTPAQQLHAQRIALRLRRVGSEARPQWLQTLKTGGRGDSALSRRGEWEVPVPGAVLSLEALGATPWPKLDPDGSLFRALVPCCVTRFERTRWTVRSPDGSQVEVALDIGQITAGSRHAPLCELELELLAGQPAALFDVARQIAGAVAVLPLNASKAERGHALMQDALDLSLHAQPPRLTPGMPLPDAAQCVLREMFGQFTANLNLLQRCDDPEAVHQARVGWRRFKSAWRLFRPALADRVLPPSWQALGPLLASLGALRDLEVALTDTLPALADAYTAGDALRQASWQAMLQALADAAGARRQSVRAALETPAVGQALLAITQWLEALTLQPVAAGARKHALRHWARQRIAHLHKKLKRALGKAADPASRHRARIAAKRLRYGIEALRPLLPRQRARRWHDRASRLQTGMGTARDLLQAGTLVAALQADAGGAEFLRGFAAGQAARR